MRTLQRGAVEPRAQRPQAATSPSKPLGGALLAATPALLWLLQRPGWTDAPPAPRQRRSLAWLGRPESPVAQVLGSCSGWVMAVVYASGRVPQMVGIWRRGVVEGLSLEVLVFAIAGNATYLSAILTRLASAINPGRDRIVNPVLPPPLGQPNGATSCFSSPGSWIR